MIHTGIPVGVAINILVVAVGWYTGFLYLQAKSMSPASVESMYELAFLTLGKASIYLISLIVVLAGIGMIVIYFIVFSQIAASLVQ